MKEEAIVMTIDFGKNYFNVIHLNNQLKLISPGGCMITIYDSGNCSHEETKKKLAGLFGFFKSND